MREHCIYIKLGIDCSGEALLGNLFLIDYSLNFMEFVVKSFKRLSSTDFAKAHVGETLTKVGKFVPNVIYSKFRADMSDSHDDSRHCKSSDQCSMMAKGDFSLKKGDEVDYEDVKVGEQKPKSSNLWSRIWSTELSWRFFVTFISLS